MMLTSFSVKGVVSQCVVLTDTIPEYEMSIAFHKNPICNHLLVGYVGNWKYEKEDIGRHGLEFGYGRALFAEAGFSYYVTSEFLTDFKDVIVAPKIGGNINMAFFSIGMETVLYTDFENNALYLMPFIGLGVGSFKSVFKFNMPLYNREIFNLNPISFAISAPIFLNQKHKCKTT